MNEQEVKKLYQALLGKGYSTNDLGDEQSFLEKMSDSGNRKQLYDFVSSKGNFRIGDFDAYESRLTGGVQQQPVAAKKVSDKDYTFTQEQIDSMDRAAVNRAQVPSDTFQQHVQKRNHDMYGVVNPAESQVSEQEKERERKQRLNQDISAAEMQLADLNKQLKPYEEAQIGRMARNSLVPGGNAGGNDDKEREETKRHDALLMQKRQIEERIATLEESRDRDTGGFWRNLWRTITNPSTWSFGLIPMADAVTASNVAGKVEDGSPLSKEEEDLLQSMVLNREAQEQYGEDKGFMARAGSITGEALPFVGEFLLTGGFGGVAESVSGAVTRNLGKSMATDLSKKGIRSWLVKSTGTVTGDVAASALMANTTGAPKTIADAANRRLGTIVRNDETGGYRFGHYEEVENGEARFVDGGKSWARSIYEAEAANTLEYYTEMLGKHIEEPLGKIGSWIAGKTGLKKAGAYMISKLGLGEVSKDLSQITANGYGRAVKHVLERGGIQDYPSEVLEEEANIALNSMFVGDNSLSDFVDARTQADIIGGMFFSVGFMNSLSTGAGAYQAAGYLRAKHQLDNADKIAGYRMTDERWRPLRERIDETDNEHIADIAAEVMADESLEQQEKMAAIKYISQLSQFRGWNVGATAQAKDKVEEMSEGVSDNASSAVSGINMSYIGGYNVDDAHKNDVKNAYDLHRQRAVDTFGNIRGLDEQPTETLRTIMGDGFTEEQRQVAIDYVNAKAAYDGMIARVQDEIDGRVSVSNAAVDSRTNKADGMVHPATLNTDRKVYIVGGDVVMNDDGTGIDKQASLQANGGDNMILAVDEESGKIEAISVDDVMSADAPIDAKGEKQAAQQQIRQSYSQQEADIIDGVLPFAPGDRYSLIDDAGMTHSVEIALDEGEGIVTVFVDGNEKAVQMPKEQVQAWANNANLARLQQFVQQMEQQRAEQIEQPSEDVNIAGENIPGQGNDGAENIPAQAEEPHRPAIERIPVMRDNSGQPILNRKGRPQYVWHEAPIGDTADALTEQAGGSMLTARDVASDMVAKAKDDLEKARKQKPKGDDPMELIESRNAIQQAEQQAQSVVKYWQDVNQEIQKRMRDESARRQAEIEAAKSEEQRQREAKEARVRKEQQDEADRKRIREAIEKENERRNREYEPLVQARRELASDREALDVLNDTEPRSLEEWVSSLLRPHSILWQDASDNEIGLRSELGLKRADIQRFMTLLGTKENGAKPFGKVALDIYEGLPEGMKEQYTDQDVRNTLLELFNEGNSGRMMNLTAIHRIEEAQETLKENLRRDAEAEAEAWAEAYHLTPEEREQFESYLEMPPMAVDEEIANQIIAENEQNRGSAELDQQPVSGTDASGIEGGQGQVQGTVEGTGDVILEKGMAESTETDSNQPSVSNDNVAGRASAARETVAIMLDQIGASGELASRMSDYEVEQMNALIEDWDAVNSDYGEVIEQQKQALQSKNKATRDAAQKVVDEAQGRANEAFEPIEQYVEGLSAKYGLETEEPFEGAIPTPKIDEPRMRSIRQALVDAYANGDTTALQSAAKRMQDYVDEGLDDYAEGVPADNYDTDDPAVLAEQYIQAVFIDRYVDDDEDQEYIKTGLKASMRQQPVSTGNMSMSPSIGKTSTPDEIQAEEAKVDNNPTEAQKEAGNYQKGHIKIDGYDITIENPKGSVRRGTDANGKKWEQEMHNTYGYIRGTEGVDGDHIDVFLSDNPTDGSVFVIDQVKPAGEPAGTVAFDEHKVMYGFQSEQEAREAYLSNYAEGWQGLGAITEVSREDFKKWVQSSHRKTKPFAEYKAVKDKAAKKVKKIQKGVGDILKKYHSLAPITVVSINSDDDLLQFADKDELEAVRKELKDSKLPATYDPESKKIYIFAENIEDSDVEEAFFHENIHRGLHQYYGDGLMELTEAFWETESPTNPEGTRKRKQTISEAYANKPDDIKEEYFVHALGYQMTTGTAANIIARLSAEHQEIVNNILHNIGYDTAEETRQRRKEEPKPESPANDRERIQENRPGRGRVNPSGNKLVTDERYEQLKERMKKKLLGQMNMGIDPEILAIGTEMAVYHIEKGARAFADYAKGMIEDLGDAIRPYLKAFYNGARELPEMEEAGYISDMTPYDDVRTFDVANFDKPSTDAMATAEEVMREQQVEQEKEEAVQKLQEQRNDGRKSQEEGVALDGTPLRAMTEADLDERVMPTYYQGRRVYVMLVSRSGEQISATQFSKPKIDYIMLTNGKKVQLKDLMVADNGKSKSTETIEARKKRWQGEADKKSEENPQKASTSKKNSVSLQQQDLFADVEPNESNYEPRNRENPSTEKRGRVGENAPKDGDLRRERTSQEESDRSERRPDRTGGERREDKRISDGVSSGESVRAGSINNGRLDADLQERRNDGRGDSGLQGGTEQVLGGSGRSSGRLQGLNTKQAIERPANPNNTHNNHAERGKDYAPRGVDARIDANIKAIELMQQLVESGAKATPEQMAVLRQYSGWGGLGKAFENNTVYRNNKPQPKYLRELLGEEAYEQANMSRNSAYYTPAHVIDTLWDIARAMGFKGGKVLEGSAGIGNILGLMPTDMSERSDIQAVEIDQTTGNILSLLYPDAKVDVQGFEATQVENGSVDLAITNVPFVTGLHVKDTTGDKDLSKKFRDIQDFCIAKNVRKLKEGGIGIFITSSGTLDNSARLREWIVQEGGADVVGAFRLNNETFGGTGATSDIIVIRKRVNGKKSPHAIDVLDTTGERVAEYNTGEEKKVKGQYVPVVKQLSMDYNKYFVEHPEQMAGKMFFNFEKGSSRYPTSKALYPEQSKNQNKMLADWAESFAEKDWEEVSAPQQQTEQPNVYESLGDDVKEGSMVVSNGKLCIAQRGKAVPLAVNANKVKGHTKVECFNAYKAIKDALSDVLEYQTENDRDAGLEPLLKKLNRAYDNFVNTYGHLHKNPAISFLKNDVDFSSVLALESFKEIGDGKGGVKQTYGKTDIFSKRVVDKEKSPEPKNVKDGIIASIYMYGRVDVPYISQRLGITENDVKSEIVKQGLGFENPSTRQMEVSYEYLSGNVREKLIQAQENNTDGRYNANIKALEKVIPINIPAHLIDFSIGSSWIDPKLYEDFVKEKTDIDVTFTSAGGTWYMKAPSWVNEEKNRSMGVVSDLLHKTIMGTQLIEAAMQNKTITVSETRKNWNGTTETTVDKEATQACANKIDEIRQEFKDWARDKMQSDPEMSERIEKTYNEMFNNYVPLSIDDAFVPDHFAGASKTITLDPHQSHAALRAVLQPVMLAHEVGAGKTFTLITAAMEMRRLGTARKPMIVVQNATVGQFVESAKELYPNAKVLTIEEADRTAEGRKNFYAKIKYNDWDMIVVPQSVFERIPDSEERQMKFVQDKIEEKMLVLEQMKDADPNGSSMIVRQAEKEIEKLQDDLADLSGAIVEKRKERDEKKAAVTRQNAEVKALEMLDRATDDVENFDDMGVDAVLVDEAHEYKHLGFATAMQRGVKGVDPSYSKKAQGVFLKTQAVLEKNNGRNVVFATGTPISNTAAEIWTFMRYLMPADTMKEYGIYYFDDFVRNFGNLQQMLEFTTSGKFKENNRFAGYVNLPELVRIWASVSDTMTQKEIEDYRKKAGKPTKLPSTELGGDKAQDIYLPQTKALRSVMKFVKAQLKKYDEMSGKEKKENSHIPLTMYGIAKAAAVDTRLVVSDAADEPQSKTNEAVRQTLRSLEDTKDYKGTVAIFADNYQNKKSGFNLYEDIRRKLIANGVPADEIVVMKSGMSVKKKLEIFDKVNRGEVRVIMGSTFTLGTGVNIQERLHTLIHLDAPNRPMDYTQRNGRILRQGNLHKEWNKPVRVLRFGVEDSLDVTAYQRLKTKGAIADSIMKGKEMMENSMENRVLEEEEDVFGDTVAQLSGSEYAMLKNQAEKEVRKFEAKKKQYESDQAYCHNEIPRLTGQIKSTKEWIEDYRKKLSTVDALPSEKRITIGKQTFGSVAEMEDYIKEFNKKLKEAENELRDNPSTQSQKRELTVNVGGLDFKIKTEQSVETRDSQGTLFTAVHRIMTYDCDALGLEDVPVHRSMLVEALGDIMENVVTGKDFRERIEFLGNKLTHLEKQLSQVNERYGKPFEFTEQLKKAHERYDEYSELMKKELEEKEKKYAEMDSEVEDIDDVSEADEAEEEEEGDDVLYRDSEEEVEEVNSRFNEELQRQIDGTLPKGHVYDMGMPSDVLLSTGIPDLPIRLQASVLNVKTNEPWHLYDLSEVKDLVKLIQKPMAIFRYGNSTQAQNLMIGLSHPDSEGRQFLVGLSLNPVVNGKELEINSIRTVFPKSYHDWIHWINQGKLLRADDKKGIKAIIDALRTNPVDYISVDDLNSAAKIVKDFENPSISEENSSENSEFFREVEDADTIKMLESQPTIKVYRSMQLIDGQLYPPMSAKVDGKLRKPTELGVWEEAEERPEMVDDKGYFTLNKGNGKSLKARYNPYIHTSRTMLNDQFSEAQDRDNLVVVEMEVPVSELTSGYKAEKAKDSVGVKQWKAGIIQGQLSGTREVILSRWAKPVRIVPVSEVADHIADMLAGQVDVMPTNVVTPQQREALEERGVKFVETDNKGRIKDGIHAGKSWKSVYGKKRQRVGRIMQREGVESPADNSMTRQQLTAAQRRSLHAFAQRQQRRAREVAEEWAQKLGLADTIHIADSIADVEGSENFSRRKRNAKGWFDQNTGKIIIVLGNHRSPSDVLQTVLHEAVGHYGLRKLFGRNFDTFLDNVYASASLDIKERIASLAAKLMSKDSAANRKRRTNQDYLRIATEEYLSGLAESTDFENAENLSWSLRHWFNQIKRAFLDMLGKLGLKGYDKYLIELSDNELRYILWRSYKNLTQPGRYRNPFYVAENIAMEVKLNVGNYSKDRRIEDDIPLHVATRQDEEQIRRRVSQMTAAEAKSAYERINSQMLDEDGLNLDEHFEKTKRDWMANHGLKGIGEQQADELQKAMEKYGSGMVELRWELLDRLSALGVDVDSESAGSELYRDGDPMDDRDKAIVRDRYERLMQSGTYQFREAVQDSMLSLRRLMEEIDKAEGGSGRIEDIASYENAYLAENALSSASHAQQMLYGKLLFNPLLDEVHRLAKAGSGRDEVTRYMMAKHGLERNMVMAGRAFAAYQQEHPYGQKTLDDFRQRDYAGLTALTGEEDVADAEAVAQQMVDAFEQAHDTGELWSLTNACTKATLEKVYKGGLLSKETYEGIRDMYEYYVPLRGFDETTSDEVYGYLNNDAPAYGSVMKKAEGRKSLADDPLAVIANMADAGIMQANRNLMKQKFLKFVMNHPSDAVSVSKMWLMYDQINDEWAAVTADINDGDTPDVVLQKTEAFEQRMKQLAETDPDHYRQGRDAKDIPYRTVGRTLNEHQVHVKMGGVDYVMTINGSPRAAQALNGLTNPDTDMGGAVGKILRGAEFVNRNMSAFYTTRNPEFVLSNFIRDMMYANSTMWVRESGNYAIKFNANFVKVNPKVIYTLIQKFNKGKLNMNNETEKAFYDFMTNGGETGYTSVKDVEKQKKLIRKYLKEGNALLVNSATAWQIVGEKLDEINRSVENCARFAAFLTSRQMGRSISRSVYDAKEVSVNFNKKGAGSTFIDTNGQTHLGNTAAFFSGAGRSGYVFWNASIQGLTNFMRLHRRHTAKAVVFDTALFVLGAVIAGYGDDDDEYWNLPEWVRRNNICIKIPGTHSFAKIPLGQEMRAIYGMGELASSVLSGNERKSGKELALSIVSQLSQTMPLDMMEGGRGVFEGKGFQYSTVAPSWVKPAIEIAENRNWMGLPIYKENAWNESDPEWTKAGKRTNKWLVNFSKWTNELTGGDDFTRGWLNWNPSKVEHLIEGTFGGYATTVNKLAKGYETVVTKEQPFDWSNVLMASRVIASADENAKAKRINSEYYKYYNEYLGTQKRLRGYNSNASKGIMEYAEKANFLYNSREYGRFLKLDEYVKAVKRLNDLMNDADAETRNQLEEALIDVKRMAVEAVRRYDDAAK